jgi:hypothetical protein
MQKKVCSKKNGSSLQRCARALLFIHMMAGYNVGECGGRGNEDYDSKLKKREDEQKFL